MPLGKEVGLGTGHIVLDGDPAPQKMGIAAPSQTFRHMSIVAKRSPISAAAELLLNFHISETMLYILLKLVKLALNKLVWFKGYTFLLCCI